MHNFTADFHLISNHISRKNILNRNLFGNKCLPENISFFYARHVEGGAAGEVMGKGAGKGAGGKGDVDGEPDADGDLDDDRVEDSQLPNRIEDEAPGMP